MGFLNLRQGVRNELGFEIRFFFRSISFTVWS